MTKKEIYESKHKYLQYKEFDKNMSLVEKQERAFILAVEVVGIQHAVIEYLLHSNEASALKELLNHI